MRRGGGLCGLGLLLALNLTFAAVVEAEEVGFLSASPYQLGDLLAETNPIYDVPISADLVHPEKTAKTMPAFVFMHGSGGRLLRHHQYLEVARSLGFITFQIDSFGPRGVSSTVGNQTNVTAAMMTTDALRALRYLAGRADVDPERIVIMGSSKGAIAALYAAWTPVRQKVVGRLDFAAYLLLYPLCAVLEDGKVTNNTVHVFIGEKDNWTPAKPCIQQVGRMKSLGRVWAITLYADAYHAFDAPIDSVRSLPHAYSMADCTIALRADGYEYETGSGYLLNKFERRLAFRACAKKGQVKIGGAHAAAELLEDVRALLVSKLN